MPPGLVELIESRMGALTGPVSDVIDAAAVGEPIGLDALTRITDAAAVEEAETRGLITLEPAGAGIEVRVAHPLYGEVRRRRAAHSRLRRIRGLLATALAESADRDDLRVVVRRATLSIESDLAPDADLLVRAANGAVWLGDLSLADRLGEAAIHAGAGPEPNFIRAHALSWLGHGEAAEAVLAGIRTDELTDSDLARFAFLRSSNTLWALGDPGRAKELIDEASRSTPPDDHTYIDAFLTVYWFAMDQPEAAVQASKSLALEDIPVVGAEIAWALAQIWADAGRTTEAAIRRGGGICRRDSLARRSAHEVQHRRRTHQCAAVRRPDHGRTGRGRTHEPTGRRPAGGGSTSWRRRGRSGRACCRRRGSRMPAAGSAQHTVCPCRIPPRGDTAIASRWRRARDARVDGRGGRRAGGARRGTASISVSRPRAGAGARVGVG